MADWQIGDMAVCVGPGVYFCHDRRVVHRDGPQKGSFVTVDEIAARGGSTVLGFTAWPDDFYAAKRFLKVTPPADLIEQERREQVPA